MQVYRFSIAWTRIYPDGYGSTVNQAGVDFYNNFIDALLDIGVEPLVTLYHWDLPQGLSDQGGWLNESISDAFANYVDTCFRLFGDRVRIRIEKYLVSTYPMLTSTDKIIMKQITEKQQQ